MARKVKLLTSLGDTSSHVKNVFEELAEEFEIHFAWGNGATGDHSRGRALDIMAYGFGTVARPGQIRPGFNVAVKNYLLKHRDRLSVKYIIWDRTIVSRSPRSVTGVDPWDEKRYNGESHANHVHVSFLDDLKPYKAAAPSLYVDYPGASHFKLGNKSDTIGRMNTRLNHKHLGAPDSREFDEQSKKAYAAWQRELGYSGADADGIPGESSWEKLRVKKDTVIASPPEPKPEPKPEPAPEPAPKPEPAPVLPTELLAVPAGVLRTVKTAKDPSVFVVLVGGLWHVPNPTWLRFLRAQGAVTQESTIITDAELTALQEKGSN